MLRLEAGAGRGLAAATRQAVWDLDPNLPIARVRTLDEVVRRAKAPMAFTMVMLLVAGAVSLALGSVGTFGVISYVVSQRTGEIGVRMACWFPANRASRIAPVVALRYE